MSTYRKIQTNLLIELMGIDWQNKSMIDLSRKNITDIKLALLANQSFPKLNFLDLSYNKITNDGIQKLMLNQLPKLYQLNLTGNLISSGVVAILAKKIDYVYLYKNQIVPSSLKGLLSLKNQIIMPKRIHLCENLIGSLGIKLFIKAKMSQLELLDLRQCQIGPEGQKHLTKPNFQKLKQLWISTKNNHINQFLYWSPNCKNLIQFYVRLRPINALQSVAVDFQLQFPVQVDKSNYYFAKEISQIHLSRQNFTKL